MESVIVSPVNVSEGRLASEVEGLVEACGPALLDVHCDAHHNRSVLTLGGAELAPRLRELCTRAVHRLDLSSHSGVHPRLGTVDVVPFVALEPTPLDRAVALRDEIAEWISSDLDVPCFVYGPERSLPEVRRRAFVDLWPDHGGPEPHPRAGAACVGARRALVAYNLWLAPGQNLATARFIATSLRCPEVQALGLALGERVQVSLNLVDPHRFGPHHAYDAVAALAPVERAELVGLVPWSVLFTVPKRRWPSLDLGEDRTFEFRLARVRARARQAETGLEPG